jgi:hypothetical protein
VGTLVTIVGAIDHGSGLAKALGGPK